MAALANTPSPAEAQDLECVVERKFNPPYFWRPHLSEWLKTHSPVWLSLALIALAFAIAMLAMTQRYQISTAPGPQAIVHITRVDRLTGEVEQCLRFPNGARLGAQEREIERLQPEWCRERFT